MSVKDEEFGDVSIARDTLTEEELAAIDNTDLSPEEIAAMQAIADEGDDDGDGDGGSDGDDDQREPEEKYTRHSEAVDVKPPESVPAVSSAEKLESSQEQTKTPVAVAESGNFVPRYSGNLPEDYEVRLHALQEEKRALVQQFKSGDIDFDEYSAHAEGLNARRDELAHIKIQADVANNIGQQTEEQRWLFVIESFFGETLAAEGIDYLHDQEKIEVLDSFIKTIGTNPKNANMRYEDAIREAHKRTKAYFGIADTAQAVMPAPAKPEVKPTRKPPVDDAPKTLAQVPGSDGPGDLAGEFANLDNLDGLDLERALQALTPAQRERYLKGE